jgi:hypothetical protein
MVGFLSYHYSGSDVSKRRGRLLWNEGVEWMQETHKIWSTLNLCRKQKKIVQELSRKIVKLCSRSSETLKRFKRPPGIPVAPAIEPQDDEAALPSFLHYYTSCATHTLRALSLSLIFLEVERWCGHIREEISFTAS